MSRLADGRRATLPRAERLRERGQFERVFRRGARIERLGFVLLWRVEPGPRAVAFTAGRRLGGSVARNRARRRLREVYRRQKGLLPAAGVRLCLVARLPACRMPFEDLSREVGDALRVVARRVAR